jgi:hypothetical protein
MADDLVAGVYGALALLLLARLGLLERLDAWWAAC